MNNFIWGNETFQNYETIAGGSGAGPGFDGAPCVQVHMTNTRATDPEVLETRFPVRVERMAHRRDPAARAWTGGEGMHRVLRFLEPVTVTTLCSHREVPVPGREGGQTGAIGENRMLRADGTTERLDGNAQAELARATPSRCSPPAAAAGASPTDPLHLSENTLRGARGVENPSPAQRGPDVRHFGFRPPCVARAPCPTRPARVAMRGFGPGVVTRPVKRERGANPRLPPQL
jgi:hypothetical protein